MTQDEMKRDAAWAALEFISKDSIVGVGTGSTVNHFIDALATIKDDIRGAVSSSEQSTAKLKQLGITVFDLNDISELSIYIDGADEIKKMIEMRKDHLTSIYQNHPSVHHNGKYYPLRIINDTHCAKGGRLPHKQ